MNKRDSLLVAVMGILTTAVIMAGFTYSRERRAELADFEQSTGQSQTVAFEERKREQEEAEKAKFLGAFTQNRETASVADFLQYINYEKEAGTVVYYGAIGEGAPWAETGLSEIVQSRDLGEVTSHYVSVDAGTALTDEAALAKVAGHKPDVVFLALPQKIEAADESALEGAELEVFRAYDAIKEKSPDALIVVLAPAPSMEESVAEDAAKSSLQTYVEHMQAASEAHGVAFYNLHAKVIESVRESGDEVKSLYNEDQTLNQEGTLLLQQAFSQNLTETPVDTRSAFNAEGKKEPVKRLTAEEPKESQESQESADSEGSFSEESLEADLAEEESLRAESEQAAAEQAAAEQAAAEQAASEQAAAEQWAAQQAAQQAAREQAAREQAAREQAAREQAIRESQEQARLEQEAAEQASREQEAAEQASSQQPPASEESSSGSGQYFEDMR